MPNSSGMKCYINCKICHGEGEKGGLLAGSVNGHEIRLWCSKCDSIVAEIPIDMRNPHHAGSCECFACRRFLDVEF